MISYGTVTDFYVGQTFYFDNTDYRRCIINADHISSDNYLSSFETISDAESKSTRTTVIVAPGEYNFGDSAFVVNEPGINIVSLTGNSDVITSSTEKNSNYNYTYGIKVTANDIFIKGIDCKSNAFYIADNLNNLICEYCTGGDFSFGSYGTASGTFNNC